MTDYSADIQAGRSWYSNHQQQVTDFTAALKSGDGQAINASAAILLGASIGSVFPGLGTLIGGAIGGLIAELSNLLAAGQQKDKQAHAAADKLSAQFWQKVELPLAKGIHTHVPLESLERFAQVANAVAGGTLKWTDWQGHQWQGPHFYLADAQLPHAPVKTPFVYRQWVPGLQTMVGMPTCVDSSWIFDLTVNKVLADKINSIKEGYTNAASHLVGAVAAGMHVVNNTAHAHMNTRLVQMGVQQQGFAARHPVVTVAATGTVLGTVIWGLVKYGILRV